MLLFTYLFRSINTWQFYLILYDFVCYVSDKVVSFSDSIPTVCATLLNANIF